MYLDLDDIIPDFFQPRFRHRVRIFIALSKSLQAMCNAAGSMRNQQKLEFRDWILEASWLNVILLWVL